MDYQEYIKTELLVLIPVLYLIGIGIKKSNLPDKRIPAVLGALGILMAAIWVITTSDISGPKDIATAVFTSITQGVLAAGASVYTNQLYVQSGKEEE